MPDGSQNQQAEMRSESHTGGVPVVATAAEHEASVCPAHKAPFEGPLGLFESLLPAEEQTRFAELIAAGDNEALRILNRTIFRTRARRTARSAFLVTGAVTLGFAYTINAAAWMLAAYPGWTSTGFIVVVGLLGGMVEHNPEIPIGRAALDALLLMDDPRAIGPLLEQRAHTFGSERRRFSGPLKRLLPRVTTETLVALTEEQQNDFFTLLSTLSSDIETEFCLAAVGALDNVGQRRSLAPLYARANGAAASKSEKLVRTEAQKVLYRLQGRLGFGGAKDVPSLLANLFPIGEVEYTIIADSLYALVDLLPRLTSEDYQTILGPGDRSRLYSILARVPVRTMGYDQVKLYREMVRLVERVGDTQAIPSLRQVATMEAPTDGGKQLRSSAAVALRSLWQQVERQKVSGTLLRAAVAPGEASDELLRAAAPGTSDADPNELLRAANEEAPETSDPPQQDTAPRRDARDANTPEALARTLEAMRRQSEEDRP